MEYACCWKPGYLDKILEQICPNIFAISRKTLRFHLIATLTPPQPPNYLARYLQPPFQLTHTRAPAHSLRIGPQRLYLPDWPAAHLPKLSRERDSASDFIQHLQIHDILGVCLPQLLYLPDWPAAEDLVGAACDLLKRLLAGWASNPHPRAGPRVFNESATPLGVPAAGIGKS
jgi:hypothetical protein